MVLGPVGKFLAPVGLILVLTGVVGAILLFFFVMFDVSGGFMDQLRGAFAVAALPFILGGAALVWMGK